jgi:hypothetical protein
MWQSTNPSIERDSARPSEELDSFGITELQNDRKRQKHKQNSVVKKKKKKMEAMSSYFILKKETVGCIKLGKPRYEARGFVRACGRMINTTSLQKFFRYLFNRQCSGYCL